MCAHRSISAKVHAATTCSRDSSVEQRSASPPEAILAGKIIRIVALFALHSLPFRKICFAQSSELLPSAALSSSPNDFSV
jgi:hypothetical protein